MLHTSVSVPKNTVCMHLYFMFAKTWLKIIVGCRRECRIILSFLHAQISQLSFFLHAGSLGKEHHPHRTSDYSIRLSVSLQSRPRHQLSES